MSYTIEQTSEGGLRITTAYYKEAELITNIFPRCYSHDTEASYGERIQMVDAIIRHLQEIVREQVAQEIESAVIEVAGNSAATMEQAARIARGN